MVARWSEQIAVGKTAQYLGDCLGSRARADVSFARLGYILISVEDLIAWTSQVLAIDLHGIGSVHGLDFGYRGVLHPTDVKIIQDDIENISVAPGSVRCAILAAKVLQNVRPNCPIQSL